MRFVRTIAGMLLLTMGIPALLAGVALCAAARHADPDGGFGARFETVRTPGRAVLVADVDELLRADWFPGAAWGLLAGGILLVALAVVLLLRPVRPREVVFVVEPDQVPVLAGRLGVSSLSGLGPQPTARDRRPLAGRQLVPVGPVPADRPRPAIGPVPSRRPASLGDLPESTGMTTTWSWPPEGAEETARSVRVDGPIRAECPDDPDADG
ncbi:hypothetical protein [Micromonospora globispora]|uniref:hypothetical protein n=1 Tax=Micromonospora globispora TaxID=1450148 RepID=UPI000F5F2398|nr:hypothetical protein [Micromonospora globispora]RQW98858.1 hypothetical protein DKL51_09545 [Micromonospora globispora]